jgi:hypothetical protein
LTLPLTLAERLVREASAAQLGLSRAATDILRAGFAAREQEQTKGVRAE